jgi:hypothetical protein
MRTARPFALAAAVALAVVAGASSAPASSAATARAATAAASRETTTALEDDCQFVWTDLNGDTLTDDTVVGDPDATAGGKAKAGALWIRPANETGGFGTAIRVIQGTHGVPGTPGTGDRFGAAIRVVDLNGDGCFDVVVAAPGESRAGHAGAGSVTVIFGSPAGLGQGTASVVLSAATTGDTPQSDERFGSVLAVEGYSGELTGVLAVGRPGKNVDGAAAAGAVTLFKFSQNGTVVAQRTITQNSANVGGHAEKSDRFGSAMHLTSLDLVVGVPGENASKGMVQVLTGGAQPETALTGSHSWSLDTKRVPGTAKVGDRFGAALALGTDYGLTIGVPGRDVGSATNAGAIFATRISYGPTGHLTTTLIGAVLVSQDTKDADGHAVAGTAETGDGFGSVIGNDTCFVSNLPSCLVVGVPGEDVSGHKDAGAIWAMASDAYSHVGRHDVLLTQGTPGVPGAVQTGNRFGAALSLRPQTLSIGVPGDHAHPHGSVIRLGWGFVYGLTTTDAEQWTPSSGVSAGAAL